MTNLIRYGSFPLHSGETSCFKIDCDALTDRDIKNFAKLIEMNVSFKSVEGVRRGGSRLARALAPYCDPQAHIHLVVDDVLTTGASIAEVMDRAEGPVLGMVLFARKPPEDERVQSMFELHPLWSVL